MKKANRKISRHSNGMRKEYDLTSGVRGKYARRLVRNANVVVLSPDVSEAFPDSKSVNEALRLLMRLARKRVS